ncbi:hypothetical protein [Hoeflea sp.]|nr:hypothetical protein [Hoeflea sp.]
MAVPFAGDQPVDIDPNALPKQSKKLSVWLPIAALIIANGVCVDVKC